LLSFATFKAIISPNDVEIIGSYGDHSTTT
jgi:hypothetical protein